jgi:hypothetical protein
VILALLQKKTENLLPGRQWLQGFFYEKEEGMAGVAGLPL